MISLAGFTRRRKALVAAFVPYLLLSVFVDYVHLHRLIAGPLAPPSLSEHLKAAEPGGSKLPDTSCAVCQWQRAGAGMQTSIGDQSTAGVVETTVDALPTLVPLRPDVGSPDFRGPPLSPSV